MEVSEKNFTISEHERKYLSERQGVTGEGERIRRPEFEFL